MDFTNEVKKNDELVALMNEKFPDVEWAAWVNEANGRKSFATQDEKVGGKNFRRDGEGVDTETFIAVVIEDLKKYIG